MTQQSGQYGFDTAVYTLKRTHRVQAGVESDIHDYLISLYIIRSRHSRGAILSNLANLQQFFSLSNWYDIGLGCMCRHVD